MARKTTPKASPTERAPSEPEPVLVHCELRIPKNEADALLPGLNLAFGCGGATLRRFGKFVQVGADLEIRTVGDIVAMGIPVLVTRRIPVEPLPRSELVTDPAAWLKQIESLG